MNNLDRMLEDIENEVELTKYYIGKDSLDARVMQVMKQVPRHAFLPEGLRYLAYHNGPAPIGWGQTISQPYIVALMSDLLQTESTDVILEIGTGSGYQAAVLSGLVAQVYSIEIIEKLANTARKRLRDLGYDNVQVRHANGYFGLPEYAPFDGIIVTAAAPHIPQALINQLQVGASMVIPVGLQYGYQELRVLKKNTENQIDSRVVLGVSFVPLTGIYDKADR